MKWDVISADPPWLYNARNNPQTRFGTGPDYPLMTTEEICQIPVESIAADPCALTLWTTMPRIPDALQVIDAWGFEYKTVLFTWVKLNRARANGKIVMLVQELYARRLDSFLHWLTFFGVGFYTKHNAELCLLAQRKTGETLTPVCDKVSQIIYAPLGGHSEKPDLAYEYTVKLFGMDLHYLDLFARRSDRLDWDTFGNEIDGRDITEAIESAATWDTSQAIIM